MAGNLPPKTSNSLCSINIWDKVGPQRFDMLRPEMRLADGLIFTFDAKNVATFESVKKWLTKADDCSADHVGRVIIGNNMTDKDAQVERTEVREVAARY